MEPIRPRPRTGGQQRNMRGRAFDIGPARPTRPAQKPALAPRPEMSAPPRPASTPVRPRKRSGMSFGIIAAALVVLLAVGGGIWWFKGRNASMNQGGTNTATTEQSQTQTPSPTDSNHIRLIASGDELPHEALTKAAKTDGSYDYTKFYTQVKPVFDGADLRFCNQETVSAGERYGISGYPSFNVSQQFARDINKVGCNVINLANNHMNDKGQAGINETLNVWDEIKPISVVGANRNAEDQRKVRYFTEGGVKFAFVGYTEISNTQGFPSYALNMLKEDLVTQQLTEARQQADIVLVSVHWGTEYSDAINAAQESWSAKFASLGADVVIGTGPHVLQPVKRLPKNGGGETLVWYSLGNMLSAQLDVPSLIGGFAVMDINKNTKKVETIGFLPTYMHYEWTPQQKAKEDLLARHDFQIYPLDKAAEPLKKSQNNTTVEAQTERVQKLMNSFTQVPILTSDQYLKR